MTEVPRDQCKEVEMLMFRQLCDEVPKNVPKVDILVNMSKIMKESEIG